LPIFGRLRTFWVLLAAVGAGSVLPARSQVQIIPGRIAPTIAVRNNPAQSALNSTDNISGTWTGSLTSNGDPVSYTWDEEFDIRQSKTGAISGTRKSVATASTNVPGAYVVWRITGSFQTGVFTFSDQAIINSSTADGFSWCQDTGQLSLTSDGSALSGNWQAPNCDGGTISLTLTATPARISLFRQDLTHVVANGTPQNEKFSYSPTTLNGTSIASLSLAPGVTASTNPNTTVLADPTNPNPLGNPSPGGLVKFTARFQASGGTATASFKVPTFGIMLLYRSPVRFRKPT
jgi:hypothetical protein